MNYITLEIYEVENPKLKVKDKSDLGGKK